MTVTPAELLDRATAAREVAIMTALVLIREHGDAQAALALLDEVAPLAPPEGDQLGVATISAQAIRDALAMGVVPR